MQCQHPIRRSCECTVTAVIYLGGTSNVFCPQRNNSVGGERWLCGAHITWRSLYIMPKVKIRGVRNVVDSLAMVM